MMETEPFGLARIYEEIVLRHPALVDDEVEPLPSGQLRWKHESRWELETLVGKGLPRRRKVARRGFYSQ